MNVPARCLRLALLRAALVALLAAPVALLLGALAAFFVLSLALATIPFSLVELTLTERRRGLLLLLWLGAYALVVGAFLQAAYMEGVFRTQSIAGSLDAVERFAAHAVKGDPEFGGIFVSLDAIILAGMAASLCLPVARAVPVAATRGQKRLLSPDVIGVTVAVVGMLLTATAPYVLLALVACGVIFVVGALPGVVVLPLVHLFAASLEGKLRGDPSLDPGEPSLDLRAESLDPKDGARRS